MAGIELTLFVGPDGAGKRRIQLASKQLRALCIKAEELMRKHHHEGHIAWLCQPPVVPQMTLDERIRVSDRVKFYLVDVLAELENEHLATRKVTAPEGPLRSAA